MNWERNNTPIWISIWKSQASPAQTHNTELINTSKIASEKKKLSFIEFVDDYQSGRKFRYRLEVLLITHMQRIDYQHIVGGTSKNKKTRKKARRQHDNVKLYSHGQTWSPNRNYRLPWPAAGRLQTLGNFCQLISIAGIGGEKKNKTK